MRYKLFKQFEQELKFPLSRGFDWDYLRDDVLKELDSVSPELAVKISKHFFSYRSAAVKVRDLDLVTDIVLQLGSRIKKGTMDVGTYRFSSDGEPTGEIVKLLRAHIIKISDFEKNQLTELGITEIPTIEELVAELEKNEKEKEDNDEI